MAETALALGPAAARRRAALAKRRYAITDLAEDLRGGGTPGEIIAIAARLYQELGDLILRASRRAGRDAARALARRLEQHEPALALRFEHAFGSLFRHGHAAQVLGLVEELLAPLGGSAFWPATTVPHPPAGVKNSCRDRAGTGPRLGAAYSVYVRTVRLALHEKGVAYDLVPVDVFAPGGPPADHLERQPFGKIPAFEHGSFRLYETGAISRYIDEAFDGPALQPGTPQHRARVNQIISIADSYIYPHLVWGVHAERIAKPSAASRPIRLAAALAKSATRLDASRGCWETVNGSPARQRRPWPISTPRRCSTISGRRRKGLI